MHKRYVGLLISAVLLFTIYEYNFDPKYYAERYPDIVETVGNNDYSLYMHYTSYGIDEGRFPNIEEELKANKDE